MISENIYRTLKNSEFLSILISVCLLIFISPLLTNLSWGASLVNGFILLSLVGSTYSIRDDVR
ncbi:MAG: hypothetical protein KZQ58_06140 [gamma proteobacterium symbiont of Bathyaustriella thionipta]|nr:hypothetical protein [gamma proteobacterium symbiont of Bathyaustriella thionipta]